MTEPNTGTLADLMFRYQMALGKFETELSEVIGFEGFETIDGDSYDTSIEFYGVDPDARLSESAQRFIWEAGFIRCWLNHTDVWQTYYVWNTGPTLRETEGFKPSEGHRSQNM